MLRKGLLDSNIWLWIGLVIVLLIFFLLYQIQQASQRSIQSNIEIVGGRSGGAGGGSGFKEYTTPNTDKTYITSGVELNYMHHESKIFLEDVMANGI